MKSRISRTAFGTLWIAMVLAAAAEARADAPGPRSDRRGEAADNPHRLPEWVWMNGEVGYQGIDLRTFNADVDTLTVGFVRSTAGGPAADMGLGVRLAFLTLGARARVASFADTSSDSTAGSWQAWSLDGEVGVHVPLDRVEPYLTFAGGYTALGELGDAVRGLSRGLDVRGANARMGLGLDYYVTPRVTLGASATGEVLALSRPEIPLRDLAEAKRVGTVNEAEARVLEADGSSWGTSLTIAGGAGLHF